MPSVGLSDRKDLFEIFFFSMGNTGRCSSDEISNLKTGVDQSRDYLTGVNYSWARQQIVSRLSSEVRQRFVGLSSEVLVSVQICFC